MNSDALQDLVDEVRSTSPQGWVIRAIALGAAVVALVVTETAAGGFSDWVVFAVAGTSLLACLRPDGHAGLVLVLVLGARWLAAIDDVRTPWSLVLALALTVLHAALALAATGPPAVRFPAVTVRRWLRRTAVVAAITSGVWLAAAAAARQDVRGSAAVTGVAIAGLVVTWFALRRRSLG